MGVSCINLPFDFSLLFRLREGSEDGQIHPKMVKMAMRRRGDVTKDSTDGSCGKLQDEIRDRDPVMYHGHTGDMW